MTDIGSRNISLVGSVYLSMYSCCVVYDCYELEAHWQIQRADGVTEVYTVVNETYHYGRSEEIPDRGLYFNGYCFGSCFLRMLISPTDLQYDGAQITGIIEVPECYNSSNVTESLTISIQGIMKRIIEHVLLKY